MADKAEKMKEVGSILKAVLTSHGGELSLKQINNEYKAVVGENIPFRALNHGSLASFLHSIPDVLTLENRGGQLVVKVVNDPNISLILCQVQEQQKSKTSGNKKTDVMQGKYHAGARQLHSTTAGQPLYSLCQQNKTNCYPYMKKPTYSPRSKYFGLFPTPSAPPQFKKEPPYNSPRGKYFGLFPTPSSSPQLKKPPYNKLRCNYSGLFPTPFAPPQFTKQSCSSTSPQPFRSTTTNKPNLNTTTATNTVKANTTTFSHISQSTCNTTSQVSLTSSINGNTLTTRSNAITGPKTITATVNVTSTTNVNATELNPTTNANATATNTNSTSQNVASLMSRATTSPAVGSNSCLSQTSEPNVKEQVCGAKNTYKQELINAVQKLESLHGKIRLTFETVAMGKQKQYYCTVVSMEEIRVSSYPEVRDTKAEAEEVASKIALEKLKFLVRKKEKPPTTADYSVSIPIVKQSQTLNTVNPSIITPPDTPLTKSPQQQKQKQQQEEALSPSGCDFNISSEDKEVTLSQSRSQESFCTSGASSPPFPAECSLPSCTSLIISDIPEEGLIFDIFVTFADSPQNFAVQPWKMSAKFYNLHKALQEYYNNPANLKSMVAIKSGQYCAFKHTDNAWYRARVEAVMGPIVSGVFVDFGDGFSTSPEKLQPLTPELCSLPCLAIKAELFGITPVNKDWSPEDVCRFRDLVDSRHLVSMVCHKEVKDNSVSVALVLMDTSDKSVVYINQVLCNEGRATYA